MTQLISLRLEQDLLARIKKQNTIPSKFIRAAIKNALQYEKIIKATKKLHETYRLSAIEVRARK